MSSASAYSLDALHGDSVRDLDSSHSRISKRIKTQTQSCHQLAEEAEKEHKNMIKKISGHSASYKKFVVDVQSSTARVCKVTVPEMAKCVERAIDGSHTLTTSQLRQLSLPPHFPEMVDLRGLDYENLAGL